MNQDTEKLFDDFTALIGELDQTAGAITRIEDEKAEAASRKRHELMDDYIKEEQALILKLRGLEQRRTQLARSLGWDGLTFRQILDTVSPSRKEALLPLFEGLQQQLSRLTQARQAAEKIIRVRLHECNTVIARQQGGSYDSSGSVNPKEPLPSGRLHSTYG